MSLKLLDPKRTFKLVSLMDDAIDLDKSEIQKYASIVDLKYIKLKDGAHPTYFHFKNPDPELEAVLEDKHVKVVTEGDDAKKGARLELQDKARMYIAYFKECFVHAEENGEKVKLDISTVPGRAMMELGAYVYNLSRLGEEERRQLEQSLTSSLTPKEEEPSTATPATQPKEG